MDCMPPKTVDLDIVQILMPSLERVCNFLEGNSPSLHMLKFLDIALTDISMFYMQKQQADSKESGVNSRQKQN